MDFRRIRAMQLTEDAKNKKLMERFINGSLQEKEDIINNEDYALFINLEQEEQLMFLYKNFDGYFCLCDEEIKGYLLENYAEYFAYKSDAKTLEKMVALGKVDPGYYYHAIQAREYTKEQLLDCLKNCADELFINFYEKKLKDKFFTDKKGEMVNYSNELALNQVNILKQTIYSSPSEELEDYRM